MCLSMEPGKARLFIHRNTLEKLGVYAWVYKEPGKARIMYKDPGVCVRNQEKAGKARHLLTEAK